MKKVFMLVTLLIGLLVALVMAELILRVVYRRLPPGDNWEPLVMCKNTRFNYKFMIPGKQTSMFTEDGQIIELKANSNGYRDSEWSDKRKKRILVLGDSFGWGWGSPADSMITNQLGMAIPDASFFNLCIPGDDLYRQYSRYRYHVKEIDPEEIIILNYTNDFFNIDGQRKLLGEARQKGLYDTVRSAPIGCDQSLNDDNALKKFLKELYVVKLIIRFKSSRSVPKDHGLKQGFQDDVSLLSDSTLVDKAFTLYAELLEEMSKDRKVTMVYIPPIYQADEAKRNEILKVFDNATIRPGLVNGKFTELTARYPNLRFVDLTETLTRENGNAPIYFPYDAHLTGRGQAVAGRYLAGRLLLDRTTDTAGSAKQKTDNLRNP
jgi:hypothetical protein